MRAGRIKPWASSLRRQIFRGPTPATGSEKDPYAAAVWSPRLNLSARAWIRTGIWNIATAKNRSLSIVPRKYGIPAVYDIIKPANVLGYMAKAAHAAKLEIRKNEMELASAAPTTRQKPDFSPRVVPSRRIAAYHAQVTSESHERV